MTLPKGMRSSTNESFRFYDELARFDDFDLQYQEGLDLIVRGAQPPKRRKRARR
jgi:hypothetical protein